MKKKIAIFGSYNGTSIGDTAILLGLISSINRITNSHIYVLSFKRINIAKELSSIGVEANISEVVIGEDEALRFKGKTLFFLKKIKKKIFKVPAINTTILRQTLSEVDYLLIGGGNLLMDTYPLWPKILDEVCSNANLAGLPYSFVGVGASPVTTKKGEALLQKCLKGSEYTYLRDKESKVFCESIFSPGIYFKVMPDLALGIVHTFKPIQCEKRKTLLVNVASLYGDAWPVQDKNKFDVYIKKIVNIIAILIDSELFDGLTVFSSNYTVDKEGESEFIRVITAKLKDFPIKQIKGRLSVAEIIQLGMTAKFSVVTRLHAGIMIHHGGAQIAAMSYHTKVYDVLTEYELCNYIFSTDSIDESYKVESILEDLEKTNCYSNDQHQHQHQHQHIKIDRYLSNLLVNYI